MTVIQEPFLCIMSRLPFQLLTLMSPYPGEIGQTSIFQSELRANPKVRDRAFTFQRTLWPFV
jgi:hypothetical protein